MSLTGKYNDELGIDLDTLFKALKNGFYYKMTYLNIKTKQHETQIRYTDYAYFYWADDVGAYFVSTIDNSYYLKDYGKTWALTKEELE